MTVQLLLTDELKATMPKTVKVTFNFGRIEVIFPALKEGEEPLVMFGDNAVIEAETDVIIKWLKPFDGVAVGNGIPQTEQFEIMHIGENL
jgi:hypothetical protein